MPAGWAGIGIRVLRSKHHGFQFENIIHASGGAECSATESCRSSRCSNRGEALLFPSFDTILVLRDGIGLSLTRLDGNRANSRKALRAILADLRADLLP